MVSVNNFFRLWIKETQIERLGDDLHIILKACWLVVINRAA